MPMDKHAYCIMAHGNWQQLQLLVNALDDVRNDIYLHVDRKAEESCLQSEFTGGGNFAYHTHRRLGRKVEPLLTNAGRACSVQESAG